MTALHDITGRLDALAIEIRRLTHQRLSAPRDAAGALDMLIDAKSREAERIADEAQRLVAAEVARLADPHSRAFDTAARIALRELRVLDMLAGLRGRPEVGSPRGLTNPWSGDAFAAPARALNVLPLHLQSAHRAIARARNAVDMSAGPADARSSPHRVA